MDDDRDLAVCAATDLIASLLGQLARARAHLRAAELQLEHLDERALRADAEVPFEMVQRIRARRCDVAALEEVLTDLGAGANHAA